MGDCTINIQDIPEKYRGYAIKVDDKGNKNDAIECGDELQNLSNKIAQDDPANYQQYLSYLDGLGLKSQVKEEPLNAAQENIIKINIPEIKTPADAAGVANQLKKIDIEIRSLGKSGDGNYSSEKAGSYLEVAKAKLETAKSQIDQLPRKDDYRVSLAFEMIENLLSDIEDFEKGNFYRVLNYDPVDTTGLDENDERTKYIKYGIDKHVVKDFCDNGVDEEMLSSYYQAGLLQPDLYHFIFNHVRIEDLQSFLSLFSSEEKIKYHYQITDNETAEALSFHIDQTFITDLIKNELLDGNSVDRESLGKYYPSLLEKSGKKDRWGKDVYRIPLSKPLLLAVSFGGNFDEKISEIKAYKKLGFNAEQILIANKVPELSINNIKAWIKEFNGDMEPFDVYLAVLNKLDKNKVKIIFENLPERQRSISSCSRLLRSLPPGKNINDLVPYLKLVNEKDVLFEDSIIYFLQNNVPVKKIEAYRSLGISSADSIKQCIKNNIPLSYFQSLKDRKINVNGSFEIREDNILEWWKNNFSLDIIKGIYDKVLDGKLPSSVLKASYLREYINIIKTPEDQNRLMAFLNNDINFYDALYCMANNLTVKDAQTAKKYDLCGEWIKKVKEYNLTEFFEAKKEARYFPSEITALIDLGVPRKDIISYNPFRLGFLVDIKRSGKDLSVFLPYSEFISSQSNVNEIETLIFFGISPETIKEYGGDPEQALNNVDRIIMTEYQKGRLFPDDAAFIKKYNLSFPSRYPVKILEKMKIGYALPENKNMPIALIVVNKSDWNSAFDAKSSIFESLLKGYNIYIYEAESDRQFIDEVKSFSLERLNPSKKIDLLMIGGHGSKEDISLSTNKDFDSGSLDLSDRDLFNELVPNVSKKTKVILSSCSTAEGGNKNNKHHIAGAISKWLGGIEVFAPNRPTSIDHIVFDTKTNLVTDVVYRDEGAEERILAR